MCQSVCDDHNGDIGSDDTFLLLEITSEQSPLKGGGASCPAQRTLKSPSLWAASLEKSDME